MTFEPDPRRRSYVPGLLAALAALVAGVVSAISGPDVIDRFTVRAQPQPSALERIVAEVKRRSEVVETARLLTDVYGPRLTGSPHLKALGGVLVERLTKAGALEARLERWGPFGPGWTTDRFSALVLAPASFPLIAFPKAWTPSVEGSGVAEAALAVVTREEDFARYRGQLQSKFVFMSPARGLESPAVTSAFARKRMEFFIREGVAALIEPGGSDGAVVVGDGRLGDEAAFGGQGFYPWPDAVAAQVVVATEQYNRVARLLEARVPVTLELNVTNTYHTAEPDSFNVIAEIPGTDLASEVVILGAHLDSWHAGTGALDNAAGCAVAIEAMRALRAAGLPLRRTVRLALWTGGEQSQLGSRAYVTQRFADPAVMELKPEHARLSAYFNVDGGTGAIRGLSTHGNRAAVSAVERWAESLRTFNPQDGWTTSVEDREVSDHVAFDAVGLPAFHFTQTVVPAMARLRHSNLDTFDRLDIAHLTQNAAVVAFLVHQAANDPAPMPRKPLPLPNKDAAGPWSPGR